MVIAEIKLLEQRIDHPELFYSYDKKEVKSNLHCGGTPTELGELLTALNLSKLITNHNGAVVPFTELVKSFESMFNIKLGDPRDVKRDILTRKIKKSVFLDRLKSSF